MGGRADLPGPGDRPLDLLRRPRPGRRRPGRSATPSWARSSRRCGTKNYSVYGRRKLTEGGPQGRPRRRPGPGGPAHAPDWESGGQPGQEALHDPLRPGRGAGPGPGQPGLHRHPSRRTSGSPTSRTARRGRASSTSRSSSTCSPAASSAGRRPARCTLSLVLDALEHGGLDPPGQRPRRADLPHRRRHPIHLDRLHRPSRRHRRRSPRSAPSATASTTPWPSRPSGCSRPSCTATPPSSAANGGPWRGLDDLEIATCAWVSWFNDERIHGELGRPHTRRGRSRVLPSPVSARCGMRKPTQRASIKPRPIHNVAKAVDGAHTNCWCLTSTVAVDPAEALTPTTPQAPTPAIARTSFAHVRRSPIRNPPRCKIRTLSEPTRAGKDLQALKKSDRSNILSPAMSMGPPDRLGVRIPPLAPRMTTYFT